MSTSTRNRQPAGIPVGGQFAASRQGRSTVVLEESFDELSDVPRDGQLVSDREAATLMDQARESASFWSRRFGTDDADEAASRAMLAYLEARARGQAGEGDEEQAKVDATERLSRDERPENVRAYVHQAVMSHTVLALQDRTGVVRRRADVKARRVFDQRINEMAVDLGRAPTRAERDALAAEIRESYPPQARPSTSFHWKSEERMVRLDGMPTEGGESNGVWDIAEENLRQQQRGIDDVDTETVPGSFRDKAEQVIAGGGRGAQLQAKSFAWQIMAEKLGGPIPVESSMSEYSAAKARKAVKAAGGAVAVARRVRSGEANEVETKALFEPFGEIDADERAAALNVITNHPGYGDDLWDASVLAATRIIERKK